MKRSSFPAERMSSDNTICLIILSAAFIAGLIAGSISANSASGELGQFINLPDAATITWKSVLLSFLSSYKYHFAILFFAFGFLGVVIVPMIVLIRGYFFSFTLLAVYASCLSIKTTFLLLGISAVYTIPCLMLMALVSMKSSGRHMRMLYVKNPIPERIDLKVLQCFAATTLILLIGTIIESVTVSKIF